MNPRKPESKARVKSVTLKDGSTLHYHSAYNDQVVVRHQWATGFQMLQIAKDRWDRWN